MFLPKAVRHKANWRNKKRAGECATNSANAMLAKVAASNPTVNLLQMPRWHVLSSAERMGARVGRPTTGSMGEGDLTPDAIPEHA